MGNTTEATINYEVYLDGSRTLGTVEITNPNVQSKTIEISGAGIAGTANVPILGHFEDLAGTIAFRTVTENLPGLLKQEYIHLEFWAAIQVFNSATGKFITPQHKIIWRAMPKGNDLGKMASASLQNRNLEFNIVYLKEYFNNKLIQELDKFNYIYKVGDEDMLASVRKALGL